MVRLRVDEERCRFCVVCWSSCNDWMDVKMVRIDDDDDDALGR